MVNEEFLRKKKVLVTGGTGFIGANLTRKLIERGFEVGLILRKQSDNWRIKEILDKIKIFYVDLNDKEKLKELIENYNPEIIYHLATYGAYPSRESDLRRMIEVNINGIINLARAAKGIPIINTGSTSEYGIKSSPMEEKNICCPDNYYGWSKLSQTLFCQKEGIPTLRLFSVYGPWEDQRRLIPTVIKGKLTGEPLNLIDSVRDYIYVDDIVNAFILAGEKYEQIKGEVINLGSGIQTNAKQLLSVIESINSKQLQIDWNFEQIQTEPPIWVSDITKAKEILGWEPSHNLKQGLEKTYFWWEAREKKIIEYLMMKSKEIRAKTIEFHSKTKIPHVGCDLSIVEILTTLYYEKMRKEDPFILSKGHASGVLYIILNDKKMIPDEGLYNLEEHPTLNKAYGIEATTGSLGHGLSLGIGMAIANKNNKVYVLMGDGECDEGQIWEAARLASELKTLNLIGIVDCNGWQGFKETDYTKIGKKFESFGWQVKECNGHNCEELLNNLNKISDKPLVILAKTIKGKGVQAMENKLESHYLKI